MAFIDKPSEGAIYQPGWFLAHEECRRETRTFKADGSTAATKTAANGGKYVPMGSVYKEGGETAIGIVYEDVDVSVGDAAGSVVTSGDVYEDRVASSAKEDLTAVTAIRFVGKAPAITRPEAFKTGKE